MEEFADASAADRAPLYKALADGRPGWAWLLRKMSDAKAPRAEVELKKALTNKEAG